MSGGTQARFVVESVKKMDLTKADIVVIKTSGRLPDQFVQVVRSYFARNNVHGATILVLGDGDSIESMSAEQMARAGWMRVMPKAKPTEAQMAAAAVPHRAPCTPPRGMQHCVPCGIDVQSLVMHTRTTEHLENNRPESEWYDELGAVESEQAPPAEPPMTLEEMKKKRLAELEAKPDA